MDRIESVVHERNDAVFRLETGESAAPRKRTITSFAGFTYQWVPDKINFFKIKICSRKQATEHFAPPQLGQKEYETPYLDDDAYVMQKLWQEKEFMKNRDRLDDEKRRAARTEDMDRFKRGAPRVFNR